MEKLNIAEILKDCPSGMELDCVTYDNVSFDKVSADEKSVYPILCYITDEKGNRSSISFTENGHESRRYGAKCVIFPKGKTTWEGFQRPFKEGDILTTNLGSIFILKTPDINNFCYGCYVALNDVHRLVINNPRFCIKSKIRLSTEEEKQKLFDAIKANGYKWNPETKTLEKLIEPKFKVGDRIKKKGIDKIYAMEIASVEQTIYRLKSGSFRYIESTDRDYELVPNKFDISTLKPFSSRVLIRNTMDGLWKPAVFGFCNGYNDNAFFIVGGTCWKQCIPYLNNEHLLGTTNDCDEYYKTWE